MARTFVLSFLLPDPAPPEHIPPPSVYTHYTHTEFANLLQVSKAPWRFFQYLFIFPYICLPLFTQLRHGSRFTRKVEEQTAWMAVNCSRVTVATFMRISWNTVGPIIERVEKDLDINPNARFDNLVRIGVDETSYRKGHKYITTVVNHDTGNVI